MEIRITGRVISKKNSKKVGRNRYTGKTFVQSSDAFQAYEDAALWQLKKYKEKFTGSIRVDYKFFLKGKLTIDVDNAMASVNDIMQKAGIIDDDDNVDKGSFEKIRGCDDWLSVIKITKI